MEAATTTGLGTSVLFWTAGLPGVAFGIAGRPAVRIVVTGPDGKTTQVRPVTVGGARLFAFPFGKGPKPWKWTTYDSSGHMLTSGKVTPGSQ